jgi:dTMP kinase
MALFVVLEGLSAVGKSTTAPLVADTLDAVLASAPPHLAALRTRLDDGGLMARMHFWMMCNYAVSDQVRELLAAGRSVVVESYFYRTLATHAAMGVDPMEHVDWDRAVTPDLAVLLTVGEHERQRRLVRRHLGPWARLEEQHVEVTRRTYESFGLTRLDTNGLDPHEVATRITHTVRSRSEEQCSIK